MRVRLVIRGCVAAVFIAYCSGSVGAVPGIDAGSLIATLDEVRRIADRDDLAALPLREVPVSHHESRYTPEQCHAVFGQEDAFGH